MRKPFDLQASIPSMRASRFGTDGDIFPMLARRNDGHCRTVTKVGLVPVEGIEPPTYRLQGGCSTS